MERAIAVIVEMLDACWVRFQKNFAFCDFVMRSRSVDRTAKTVYTDILLRKVLFACTYVTSASQLAASP